MTAGDCHNFISDLTGRIPCTAAVPAPLTITARAGDSTLRVPGSHAPGASLSLRVPGTPITVSARAAAISVLSADMSLLEDGSDTVDRLRSPETEGWIWVRDANWVFRKRWAVMKHHALKLFVPDNVCRSLTCDRDSFCCCFLCICSIRTLLSVLIYLE